MYIQDGFPRVKYVHTRRSVMFAIVLVPLCHHAVEQRPGVVMREIGDPVGQDEGVDDPDTGVFQRAGTVKMFSPYDCWFGGHDGMDGGRPHKSVKVVMSQI